MHEHTNITITVVSVEDAWLSIFQSNNADEPTLPSFTRSVYLTKDEAKTLLPIIQKFVEG